MFLVANALGNTPMDTVNALGYGLLGYTTVFLGLVLLMVVVTVIGKVFIARDKKEQEKKAAEAAAIVQTEVVERTAPGSAGQLKLHDVEPKTAAMLMAIVADKMGKPINELRFISIKEVK